jgi:uncharacterized membrane protein
MSSLAQAKTLGEIGSILVLLTIIPFAGRAIGLVGLVLILVSVKYISDVLADKSIFNNMLISIILAIVGIVIGIVLAAAVLVSFFRGFMMPFEPSVFMRPGFFSTYFTAFILALTPIWIFCIASAIFLKKSYDTIASKLNISMFSTAALLYLIGAVLVIVFIGVIIIFIAIILQAVAFFSIPEQLPQPPQPAQPAVQPM